MGKESAFNVGDIRDVGSILESGRSSGKGNGYPLQYSYLENSMRVKEEGEKAGLKLNIQKSKIMASSPITSWQIDGGKVQAVTDIIFSKITADGDFSHEIRRQLPLGRKARTNLNNVLKSRDKRSM